MHSDHNSGSRVAALRGAAFLLAGVVFDLLTALVARHILPRRWRYLALPLFGLVPFPIAHAQEVETNTPPETASEPSTIPFLGNAYSQPSSVSGYSGMLPATPFAGTSQLSSGAPPITFSPGQKGLARVGFATLIPHIDYQVSYGNNVQSSPGQRADTLINELSPGILITLGTHWFLDYTPTLRFYSTPKLRDAVDQVVSLTGVTTYESWRFGFSQAYSATSQPLIETASQLDQEVYSTSLTAAHPLGSKLSVDVGLYQNFRYVEQGQQLGFNPVSDSLEWSARGGLNYQIAQPLSVGLTTGVTYDDVSVGPDMISEQYQGNIKWTPTQKLSFTVTGGIEDRQFLASTSPDLISPIFGATATYRLFDYTTLSLAANRSVSPSFFPGSLSEPTFVTASVRQRLLGKLFLEVSGGYDSTTYHQSASQFNSATATSYDATSINVRLSTILFKRASASVFFNENFITSGATSSSNSSLFDYTTRQYGLALGYHW